MSTAQKLYEAGLITYMRTDSVTISEEAKSSILSKIESKYGDSYVNLRNYKNKNKSAQEAHEAVRPTDISVEDISQIMISKDCISLYGEGQFLTNVRCTNRENSRKY